MAFTPKTNRREQILDVALELFNEMGSGRVTTNHIAKDMGISPGNLYYYYKSKEHIIRELLKRLIEGFDVLLPPQTDITPLPQYIDRTIEAYGDLIFKYRFIYLELAALLARDEQFKEMYLDIKVKRDQDFRLFFDLLASMGVLRQSVTPKEQEAMIFIIWTYAEGIVTALHSSNIPVSPENIQAYFGKIILLFKPYLEPALWPALSRPLDRP